MMRLGTKVLLLIVVNVVPSHILGMHEMSSRHATELTLSEDVQNSRCISISELLTACRKVELEGRINIFLAISL